MQEPGIGTSKWITENLVDSPASKVVADSFK